MSLRASLGRCVLAALISAAGAASAQSPSSSPSIARASAASDDCVRYVEGQAMVVRCAAAPQVLADHGGAVGEPYDVQGNPVDRHGDVVAVPESRGRAAREVFARDSGTPRK